MAGRILTAVGTGGLYLLRSFNLSFRTAKFVCFKLPIARGNSLENCQLLHEQALYL